MAEQTLTYQLTSIDRLVMRNYQPAHRAAYEPNADAVGRDQYIEHLYMGQGGPVIPGEMVEAVLNRAAGEKVPATCADAALEYDGPRTADGLWFERTFAWIDGLDFYPAFQKWAVTVEVTIDADVVNPEQVDAWMEYAGKYIGLGDGQFMAVKAGGLQESVGRRPRHGRFQATRL